MTATAIESEDARAKRRDTAFLGHPAGLGWLSATELWERFSYYGMTNLLVLYMVHYLLLGHSANIIGFAPFQSFVAWVNGPAATQQALASHIYGLYTSSVYATPIIGGYLADRFLGRTTAVTAGALSMALGHFLMAFDNCFVIALLCLAVGVGLFKGNIASQVGALYTIEDPRRATAFQIFLLAVQFAVIASPFICGTLAERVGWHWGFGAAGIGMLIGLATYLLARPYLPPEPERRAAKTQRPPVSRNGWLKIAILVALLPVLAVGVVGNQQIGNAYPVWAERDLQMVFFGFTMPTTWLQSIDAIISAITMLGVVAFWKWWATRWVEPDELAKITMGVAISALAPLAFVAAAAYAAQTHQKAGFGWVLLFEVINDIGFANVLPVGLALYSRSAPVGTGSIMIGVYYLHLVAAQQLVGRVGGLLDTMPASRFWLLHVWLMLGAAAVLLVYKLAIGRILAPAYTEAEAAAAR